MMVDLPSSDVAATHVVVGSNVVWALTKDNKVRKSWTDYHKYYQSMKLLPLSKAVICVICIFKCVVTA